MFNRWKETYTWSNINCCVQNIIVGKLWIEQHGVMEIKNHSTGHSAKLTFKSSASTEKDLHRVEGFVKDEKYVFKAINLVQDLNTDFTAAAKIYFYYTENGQQI